MFKKKIFWYQVFPTQEAAYKNIDIGDLYAVNIQGKNMLISRTAENFVAYEDKCPHQGVKLSTSKCAKEGIITCPWHKYKFDLKNGEAIGSHAFYLKSFPTKISENGLHLGIEKTILNLF